MLTLTTRKDGNDRLLFGASGAREVGSQLKKLQRTRRSYSLDDGHTTSPLLVNSHVALEENVRGPLLTRFQKRDILERKMKTHWSYPSFTDYLCSETSESPCEVRFELADDVVSTSSSDLLPLSGSTGTPPRSTLSKYVVTGKQGSSNQLWKTKRLSCWSNMDICHWLQHVNLDSILPSIVGSEFIGKDLENWNDEVLTDLGVTDGRTRELLLEELSKVRAAYLRGRGIRPRALFPLLADQRYEIVKAVSISPNVMLDKLSITEQSNGGLALAESYASIGLLAGDIIVELNGACCVGMAKQYFQLLLSRTRGQSRKLVIFRKRFQQVRREVSRC
uniref:SAM domain-containing protein n=1 Tax=Trichuris muris TaxID=70415 RepID=A0A5S6R3R1_TRIMR